MLRTDDRRRPNRSKRQKSACHGGPSTYDDLRARARQRPILDRLWRPERAEEVAEIVGQRVELETHGIGSERTARQPRPVDRVLAFLT